MVLVDGMNVIGSRPDGWWRDRTGAMARLVAQLDAWAAGRDDEVVVVLDGRERDVGSPSHVGVRFARVADDLLAELAGPGDVVFTSDRALADRVRARGAEVRRSGGLLRELAADA